MPWSDGFPGAWLVPFLIIVPLGGCTKGQAQAVAPEAPAVMVEAHAVAVTTEEIKRRFSGYSHPWDARGVGFMVAGRVTSLKVQEGDRVTKGQLLATIGSEDYALITRLAKIQIEALKPNLERVDSLVHKRVLPESQLDEIKGKYDAATTQREQASRQLKYTRLMAPVDGVVMERQTSVGQVIGAGMPAYILLELERMKVKFGVTQRDLALFSIGHKVTLSFPGVADHRWGTIIHVDLVADATTRTFNVVVEVPNADGLLRPSLLAHLDRTTKSLEGLFVPLYAVKRNSAGERIVMLVDKGVARERPVELGDMVSEKVQILKGLQAGDQVIVKGQEFIRHGDRVTVR